MLLSVEPRDSFDVEPGRYRATCADIREFEKQTGKGTTDMSQNPELAGKRVVQCASSRGARKVKTVSAGNICFYTLQHMKSGRRSTGSSVADVMVAMPHMLEMNNVKIWTNDQR
jgi:hypothetical protein